MDKYLGMTVGKLTLIRRVRAGGRGIGAIWLAKCLCGNELEVIARKVAHGEKTQCANCSSKITWKRSTVGLPPGLKRSYAQYIRALATEHPGTEPVSPNKFILISYKKCGICHRKPCGGARGMGPGHPPVPLCTTCCILADTVTLPKLLDVFGRAIAAASRRYRSQ